MDSIKTLTFHFNNGEIFVVPVNLYIVQVDVAGLFIKEKVSNKSQLLTPTVETRTVKFIQMSNVNWIDFEYED